MAVSSETDQRRPCPRCQTPANLESAYCERCGYPLGRLKPVPRWHLHRRLYNWTLAWAYRPSSGIALFVLAFSESSFFPVPPDVLLMPLALGNRRRWARYASISTAGSVLGACFGYVIGMALWHAIAPFVFHWLAWANFTPGNFKTVQGYYNQNVFWAVFLAGFTIIPFKVFTIAAGVFGASFPPFILAAIVSRGGRFFLVAGLMRLFGAKIAPFIEKYFNWLALAFAVLLVGGFVVIKYLR